MTSARPYRRGVSAARAFESAARCAGAQFCPDVVEALTRLWDSGALADVEDAPGADPLGSAQLQYRGVAADAISRRRDRSPVSGSGLVYRGQTIREAPPRA